MKLAGGGLLVTLIIWPPFLYKIGKGMYYVSQMSVSDMWYGILAGTGLMVWGNLDVIYEICL